MPLPYIDATPQRTEGTVSSLVAELAEEIKEKGRRSAAELPPLLEKAETLAHDESQDLLTRALAHRAAANALQLLNQFETALIHYNHATEFLERLNEPRELGRTLHAKVAFLSYLGRFEELFECAAKARALFLMIDDRRHLGRLDSNLAYAYFRLDRHVESLQCSDRALTTLEEVGDEEGVLAATINSAVTLSSMHEFERAEQRFERALELATEMEIPAWARLSRYNLAYLRYLRGDSGQALRELTQLREEYRVAKEDRQLCVCWLDEAEILMEIGDLEESINAAREAQALASRMGLNYEIGKSLLFEAAAGRRLGRQSEALQLLEKAIRRFETEGNKTLVAVSKLQAAMFRGEQGEPVALGEAARARSALRASGLPHRLALADIVIGRIQRATGDLQSAIETFKSALRIAETSRSKWMQFHACYELGLTMIDHGEPDGVRLLRQAEGMLDSLWNRLGSDDLKMAFLGDRENVYTHLVRSTISESPVEAFELSEKARSRVLRERLVSDASSGSLPAIQSRLSPGETVVEYFLAGDDLCIFGVRSDGLFCVRRAGAVERIKHAWSNLDRHISSCSVKWERLQAAQHHLTRTALAHLESLYAELIAPIRSELRGSIVFVPHGFLHGIPIHALYDGNRFLSDCHVIAYSPSASLYTSPPPELSLDKPLFVAFSGNDHATSIEEVEAAASTFQDSTVLVNPSLHKLRDALDSARKLVHIAGHAEVDMVGGKMSWIETPEGRLTSRDLTEMQIRARTIVITGCQTARRLIQPGDEWLGLMRAFYMSGASTIVSAFWDIRDESARRFSSEFYRHFDGDNAAAVAQKASAAVREWRAHPYFWAGFGIFARKHLGETL
jgi:tetratricopeptide (TPR) repeat protein